MLFNFFFLLMLLIGAIYFWERVKKSGMDFAHNYLAASSYFVLWSAILVVIFLPLIREIINNPSNKAIGVLMFAVVGYVLIYLFTPKYLDKPTRLINKYSTALFLQLDYKYFAARLSNIIFQQIGVVLSVFMMMKLGLALPAIVAVFLFLFGFVHLPLIKLDDSLFGSYFVLSALIGAVLFPVLILSFHYGFVYSFILHIFFYVFSGFIFWAFPGLRDSF